MPGYIWYNPNAPASQYRTMLSPDPNVPNGYVLSGGTDGAQDRDQQTFRPGAASGGFPTYPASPDKATLLANIRDKNGSQSPNASNSPY